jgi:hypothetical protein
VFPHYPVATGRGSNYGIKIAILLKKFFFLDLECGYLLFALDYIAIMALFAMVMHLFNAIILIRQTRT